MYIEMFKTRERFAMLAAVLSNVLESDMSDKGKLDFLKMVKDAAMEAGAEKKV